MNEEENKTDANEAVTPLFTETADNSAEKKDKLSDLFTVQITICIILLTAFTVLNLINAELTCALLQSFKKLTDSQTEKTIQTAAEYIARLMNG